MLWFLTQSQIKFSSPNFTQKVLKQLNCDSKIMNVGSIYLLNSALSFNNSVQSLSKINNYNIWKKLYSTNFNSWSMELVLRFGVNNNYIIFSTPTVPNVVLYRNFLMDERSMKTFNRETHSEMIFGFTTGRCGFSRNQKRSFLAIEITLRATVWFCKQMHKFLNGVKIRFLGSSKKILRHMHHFKRFNLGKKRVQLHSMIDITPTPYNGVRQKLRGRKRYRYHKYTFKRFVKMFNRVQTARPINPNLLK